MFWIEVLPSHHERPWVWEPIKMFFQISEGDQNLTVRSRPSAQQRSGKYMEESNHVKILKWNPSMASSY